MVVQEMVFMVAEMVIVPVMMVLVAVLNSVGGGRWCRWQGNGGGKAMVEAE